MLDDPFAQLPKRLAAVADCCFFLTLDFPQGAAIGRVVEDGVVAEPVPPLGLRGDFSFDDAHRFKKYAPLCRDRDAGDEPRGTRLQAPCCQLLVNRRELRWIVGPVPARRVDARRVVEGGDLETRIVRDGRDARLFRVIERLQPRVLREGGAGFVGFEDVRKPLQRDELNRDAVEDAEDFADLSRIGCRYEESTHVTAYGSLSGLCDEAVARHFFRNSPTIVFWIAMSCLMPSSASSMSASSARRSKGRPSAVPWSSMKRPSPVLTKFMSTSAFESSS